MSSKRTFLIVGSSLLALGAGGGALALADGPGRPAAAQSTATQGMSRGMATNSMMKELNAAGMRQMAAGMPMKVDARQLKQMTDAHNKMVRGMMDGDPMMRDAAKKMGG